MERTLEETVTEAVNNIVQALANDIRRKVLQELGVSQESKPLKKGKITALKADMKAWAAKSLEAAAASPPKVGRRKRSKSPQKKVAGAVRPLNTLDDTDQQMWKLLENPVSVNDIAEKLSVSVPTVYNRINRFKTEDRLKQVREGTKVFYKQGARRGPKKKAS